MFFVPYRYKFQQPIQNYNRTEKTDLWSVLKLAAIAASLQSSDRRLATDARLQGS